jgi:hypothetical protein
MTVSHHTEGRLAELRRRIDVQELTDVKHMLCKILATPDL